MNRRHALTVFGASAAILPLLDRRLRADEPLPHAPTGLIEVSLNREFPLVVQSVPVVHDGNRIVLVTLENCTLSLDTENRLRARVRANVLQYANVDYWISLAVFDKQSAFLGAATHKETIQYIRLGATPMVFRELEFDFGISNNYAGVARMAAAISVRDVAKPG